MPHIFYIYMYIADFCASHMASLADVSAISATLGITSLRDHQKKVLEYVQAGMDCFVVLPTGSGKSLSYQLAPFLGSTGKLLVHFWSLVR